MEDEVRIRENEGSSKQNIIEKLKENKIIIIICCVILVVIILFFLFKGKGSSGNGGRKLEHYDYLIVGSGLYGATFNYLAKQAGKTTYVVEKRDVIGGNLYCDNIEGIFVHKYGPHVFHTDNKKVWDFVNNMTHFNPYIQQTVARVEDKLYSLPFNMWTFNQLWGVTTPEEAKAKIDADKYTGEVHNLEAQAQSFV
jgi:UDP-galactopyranose mutase